MDVDFRRTDEALLQHYVDHPSKFHALARLVRQHADKYPGCSEAADIRRLFAAMYEAAGGPSEFHAPRIKVRPRSPRRRRFGDPSMVHLDWLLETEPRHPLESEAT